MSSTITEREVAAGLAAALEQRLQQGGSPFEKITVEHHAEGGYPDLTIWRDYAHREAFAFWELKAPGLKEDLSKLPAKAQSLGVRYVVVWNFQQGELYELVQGQLVARKSYPVPVLNALSEWSILPKRMLVFEQAKGILEDLVQLYHGQVLMPYVPEKFYFIGILQKAIHYLVPVLHQRILQQRKNRQVHAQLNAWATQQGYPSGLEDLDLLLARHWAYSSAVRILFYFTVRRYHPGLPDLKPAPGSRERIADLLVEAFSKAQSVDWQAVFEFSPLDKLGLPPEAEPILDDLLDEFHRYDFGRLKEDVIGQIMEGLIPEEERHALGQYFTREDLVDLILGFVANTENAFYLDPTCGSGTFLNRLYSRLRWLSGYGATHGQLLERLWGVDVAHFPAELATINLFRQNVRDLTNFPRILVQDFFDIQPGQCFRFPPPKTTDDGYRKIDVSLPMFHGIVGNFPYIRQELIERQIKHYKRKIVQAIAQQWFERDPELFHRQLSQSKMTAFDLRLSGQADIYAYLFYHAAAFLEEGGRIGIVTSNSWLDVAYGMELKRFFLRHFKLIAVVASWAEPWFEDAAINTAFVILERCENPDERARNIVRFVKVKKTLAEVLPRDLLLREPDRWKKVDALVRQIETAHVPLVPQNLPSDQPPPFQGVHTVETDEFRIRLVSQAELERDLAENQETAKWGLYIRAPQVYFDLLQSAKGKLVPLSQVAKVRRGYTTGINEFFYLEPLNEPAKTPGAFRVKNSRGWIGEIEQECLCPVMKSPKESPSLLVDRSKLKYRVFLPPIDPQSEKPELELRKKFPLAYRYVRWGEQQRTSHGHLWPDVPTVQHRKAWWFIADRKPGCILMPMINNRRFAVFQNSDAYVDHNLFELLVSAKESELVAALMNSTLFALMREVISRVNLGDGATKTEGIDWRRIKLPNPEGLSKDEKASTLKAYRKLKRRVVQPITEEVKQKDRQALDRAVLEALGLDPDSYLPKIYEGLVEMVQERLAIPKLRANRKKQERRFSLEKVKEQIRREILPGGLKSIVAFLPAGSTPMLDIPLTGRPVTWQPFINECRLLDAYGQEVGKVPGNEKSTRYAIYAAKTGEYLVQIPADPVAAGLAVQHYEHYLRQIAQELSNRALDATHDFRHAERIVRDILASLDLPPLAIEEAMTG